MNKDGKVRVVHQEKRRRVPKQRVSCVSGG